MLHNCDVISDVRLDVSAHQTQTNNEHELHSYQVGLYTYTIQSGSFYKYGCKVGNVVSHKQVQSTVMTNVPTLQNCYVFTTFSLPRDNGFKLLKV